MLLLLSPISSQILRPGGAITMSNTPISLVPGDMIAVEGTNSELLAPITSPLKHASSH